MKQFTPYRRESEYWTPRVPLNKFILNLFSGREFGTCPNSLSSLTYSALP